MPNLHLGAKWFLSNVKSKSHHIVGIKQMAFENVILQSKAKSYIFDNLYLNTVKTTTLNIFQIHT